MTERLTILVEERGTRVVRRRFRDLGDKARRAGDDVDFLGTALKGLAAAGAVAALTAATSAAVEFADALAEVSTLLTGDNIDQQINEINDSALQLSRTYGGTAVGQARAFYQAISAGAADAAEATEILNVANQLAVGGVTDVFTATDGLTTVLNAYGDAVAGAADVSDTLFVGVRAGKTTVEELSSALGRVAPLAAQVGVDFDQLVAATAALTKGGISTAESITGLRAVLAAVSKPSSEAVDLAEQLGIEFNVAALQAKGLEGFLQSLTEATGGNTEALARLFGGVEALVPILALTGSGAEDFTNILGDMEERAGSTQEAFDRMANSPGFQLGRVVDALTAELIELGQVVLPLVTAAARFLADNMSLLFDILKTLGTAFLVSRVIAFSNTLISTVRVAGQVQAALGKTTLAMGLFNAAAIRGRVVMNALTIAIAANPIGLLIVALTTAITLLYRFSDAIKVSSDGMATLGDVTTVVFNRISQAMRPVIDAFQVEFPKIGQLVEAVVGDVNLSLESILITAATIIDGTIGVFRGGFAAARQAALNALNGISVGFSNIFNTILNKHKQFLNEIIGGFNQVASFFGQDTIGLFQPTAIADAAIVTGKSASDAFAEGFEAGGARDFIRGVFDEADALAASRLPTQGPLQGAVAPTIPGGSGLPTIPGGSGSRSGGGIGASNELLEARRDLLREIQGPQQQLRADQIALTQLFDQGAISLEQYNAKMRELNVTATSFDNTISGGVSNGLARIAEQANNVGSQVSDFVVGAFNSATDAIVEFAKTGQFNIRQFFSDLFAQLLKLAVNQIFSQLVGGFLGGGGLGAGGLLGGLLGFQNGGDFVVGGNNNTPDSQLVAFRATRGERVSVETPGQQRQGDQQGGPQIIQAPAPQVVVQVGPREIREALSGEEGDRLVVNAVQRKASSVNKVLRGGSQ